MDAGTAALLALDKLDATKEEARFNYVDAIIAYESGEATDDEVLELFQYIIDHGFDRHLQGHYGRMAQILLDMGLIAKR